MYSGRRHFKQTDMRETTQPHAARNGCKRCSASELARMQRAARQSPLRSAKPKQQQRQQPHFASWLMKARCVRLLETAVTCAAGYLAAINRLQLPQPQPSSNICGVERQPVRAFISHLSVQVTTAPPPCSETTKTSQPLTCVATPARHKTQTYSTTMRRTTTQHNTLQHDTTTNTTQATPQRETPHLLAVLQLCPLAAQLQHGYLRLLQAGVRALVQAAAVLAVWPQHRQEVICWQLVVLLVGRCRLQDVWSLS